ncbi:ADP-ribosyl cyclase/cyclic ADP-ribose hydrolase 1 [Clonorchis sinensis]|uniref:ADP-ribosyl cyclase/cyclic ADP-ribose hydrolase 1 n=1 Tax=Clonorchis sinensis TaxID=79923 RepID=A0A419QGI9_CLOSI|nr:ADP-ribosyl cyclase/cyclic ADP-ribose hydrolase 1 [Clonorchis sinensis]
MRFHHTALFLGLMITTYCKNIGEFAPQQLSLLQRLVIGRCSEWAFAHAEYNIDCQKVWTDFQKIITDSRLEHLCTMDPNMFDQFVSELFKFEPEMKKPFFWSRSGTLAMAVCRKLGICDILEGTLPGFIFNELNWCDRRLTAGTVYQTQCGCSGEAQLVYAFWKSASKLYSQLVEGDVGLLLNGSLVTPYDKNRTFGSSELPNLYYPRVKKLTAYLAYNLEEEDVRPNAGCNSESLLNLKADVLRKNITYVCTEQPAFVFHYLCAANPTNKRCLGKSGRANESANS